jgi:hypothetical protein
MTSDLNLQEVIAERDACAQELFESNRIAAQLVIARQALADQLATIEQRVRAEASREVDAARVERDRAFAERDAAYRERDRARAAQREAEAMLARVTGSTAWRVTAPLRRAIMVLRGRDHP